MPVHPDNVTNSGCDGFQSAAVQIETVNLGVSLRRHADVAGSADLEIELVVGSDGQVLPTVSFVLRQIAEDDGRLRRSLEARFDIVYLRDLRKLGDIESAVMQ